jgi:hypothetical protein
MYKIFSYQIPGLNEHNTIEIRSLVSTLTIRSIYTINSQNVKIELLQTPIEFSGLHNSLGFAYKNTISKFIYIDINISDNSLLLSDLLEVIVTNSKYKTSGSYNSPYLMVNAGEFIQPVFAITNPSDILVDCILDLKLYDRYSNVRTQNLIPLVVNNDGKLVYNSSIKDTKFVLPLAIASVDDISIYVENRVKVSPSEYSMDTVNPNTIIFDSRNLGAFTVIYVPAFYKINGFTKITNNISINKNNLIQQTIKDIDKIEYRFMLNMINLDFTTIDETPIIKTLGLITY